MLQGLSASTQIAAAKLSQKTIDEHLGTTKVIYGVSGIANGLRSWFSAKTTGGIILTTASGVVMRWRKIRMDQELGYENKNFVANLTAGGATALLYAAALNKGPGAANAVAKTGILVSEIIAGRGSPGVIIGTSVEIGVDLLTKHPIIRPFAVTLAAQTSALIQLGEAMKVASDTGKVLDIARATRREQVQKANSIMLLLKKTPEYLVGLSAQEAGLILTTAQDPFSNFRQKMK